MMVVVVIIIMIIIMGNYYYGRLSMVMMMIAHWTRGRLRPLLGSGILALKACSIGQRCFDSICLPMRLERLREICIRRVFSLAA